ncbi:MAG: RDD family protein [Geitlerinemataceae cyanobacterium]
MSFFNRVKIKTPESVEIEFTLAGIGNRAQALLIDYVYWLLSLLVLLLLGLWFIFAQSDFLQNLAGSDRLKLWYYAILGLIFFFVYVGYFVFFETFWQGQTPGKRRAKIRVIRNDGRPIGLPQATLRTLLRPIDELFFIGAFMIMLGKREKRLGDFVAGTLVVQDEEAVAAAEFPISEKARDLADRLLQVADLSSLQPDDFAAIREYLQRRPTLFPDAKTKISRQLTQKAKAAIALERMPKGITTDLFLEAVYFAYQKRE